MSIAINVRDIATAEVVGTPQSSENSNTVIGLIKRIYSLLSNFVTRVANLTTRVDSIAETVEDLSSLGENQGSSLLGLVEQVNSNGTRITNLENTNQTINSNINSNTNRISALETADNQIGDRISALESADNQIGGQIASLNSQINTNLDNILDNRTRIISLENATSLNSSNINTLGSTVSTNSSNISTLQSAASTNSSNISTLQSTVNTNSTDISKIQTNLKKYIYFCRNGSFYTFSFCVVGSVQFSWWNTSTNTLNVSKTYVTPIEIKYTEGNNNWLWISSNNSFYYLYSLSFKIAFGTIDGIVANPYNFLECVTIKTQDPNIVAPVSHEFRILPYYKTELAGDEAYYGKLPSVFLKRGELLRCAQSRSTPYQGSVRFWIRDVNNFNFTPGPSDVIQIIDGEFWSATNPVTFTTHTIINESY